MQDSLHNCNNLSNRNTNGISIHFTSEELERIQAIFTSLSKQELRYLKHFLNAFHGKGSNKALALVELLEKKPTISQDEASEKLYNDPKSKAFIMLKGRLLEKMQETLSLSINLQNNTQLQEDPAAYEVISIIKKLSAALMLRKRGLEDIAREIFEKCELEAKSAGLPEFRLPSLLYLQNLSPRHPKGNSPYTREIDLTLSQYQTDIVGIGVFDEFTLLTRKHSHFGKEQISWLLEKTTLLGEELEKSYTVRTHYFYLNLLVSYYESIRDYPNARKALEELIDLSSSHKGLRSKNRLGTPYLKLASIECMAYHFEAALDAALKARDLYHPRKYNYFYASVYAIYTHLYVGQIKEAEEILKELEWFNRSSNRTICLELTHYLNACLAYFLGEIKHSYQALRKVQEILTDKEGWNTSMRIYEIMLLIDLDDFDLASARIEALRKHLAKYPGEERQQHIFRWLYLLEKNAFNFHTHELEMQEIFIQLRNSDSWRAISHELVRVDAWIAAKKQGIPLLQALRESFCTENVYVE